MKTSNKSQDAKLMQAETGICSRILFHIINQKFGNKMNVEENATLILTGGILKQDKLYNLMIGASLGAGAESFKETDNTNQSIFMSIRATQQLVKAFKKKQRITNRYYFTGIDFNRKNKKIKEQNTDYSSVYLNIANQWAPEAIDIVEKTLSNHSKTNARQLNCYCCASRVIKEMGGNDTEAAIVAGLSGGIGMSGSICGAFSAALWFKALKWLKDNPTEITYPTPLANNVRNRFLSLTKNEVLCPSLCGKTFKTIKEHTNFISEGGCNKLINMLAQI